MAPWARSFQSGDSWMLEMLEAVAQQFGFTMETPLSKLSEEQMNVLLYGNKDKHIKIKHKTYQGTAGRSTTRSSGCRQHRQATPRRNQVGHDQDRSSSFI